MGNRGEFTAEQIAKASSGPDDQSKYQGLRAESAKTLSSVHFMSQFIELAEASIPAAADDPVPEAEVPTTVRRAEAAAQAALEEQGDVLAPVTAIPLPVAAGPVGAAEATARPTPMAGDPFAGMWALKESVDALVLRLDRMEARLVSSAPPAPIPAPAEDNPQSEDPSDPYAKSPSEVRSLAARREERDRAANGTPVQGSARGPAAGGEVSPPAPGNAQPRSALPGAVLALRGRIQTILSSQKFKKQFWLAPAAAVAFGVIWSTSQGQTPPHPPPVSIEAAFEGMTAYARLEAELLRRDIDAPDAARKRIQQLRELHGLAASEQERAAIEAQLHELISSQEGMEARAVFAKSGLDKLRRASGLSL